MTNQNFVAGAVLGSLVGAASVLLFTPVSGAKVRNRLLNGFAQPEAHKPRRKASLKPKKPQVQKKHAS